MANFYDLTHLEVANEYVTIRRYRESDFAGLNAIFKQEFFMWFFTAYKNCQEFVKEKIDEFEHGDLVMLVIIDNLTGNIIGTSSLYDISFRHKRVEIGSSGRARLASLIRAGRLSESSFIFLTLPAPVTTSPTCSLSSPCMTAWRRYAG